MRNILQCCNRCLVMHNTDTHKFLNCKGDKTCVLAWALYNKELYFRHHHFRYHLHPVKKVWFIDNIHSLTHIQYLNFLSVLFWLCALTKHVRLSSIHHMPFYTLFTCSIKIPCIALSRKICLQLTHIADKARYGSIWRFLGHYCLLHCVCCLSSIILNKCQLKAPSFHTVSTHSTFQLKLELCSYQDNLLNYHYVDSGRIYCCTCNTKVAWFLLGFTVPQSHCASDNYYVQAIQ